MNTKQKELLAELRRNGVTAFCSKDLISDVMAIESHIECARKKLRLLFDKVLCGYLNLDTEDIASTKIKLVHSANDVIIDDNYIISQYANAEDYQEPPGNWDELYNGSISNEEDYLY
jgi:hypothetical protein